MKNINKIVIIYSKKTKKMNTERCKLGECKVKKKQKEENVLTTEKVKES